MQASPTTWDTSLRQSLALPCLLYAQQSALLCLCTTTGLFQNSRFCCAGIATSLKILFSQEDCSSSVSTVPQLHLERNEVIALVNLLERLSKSIEVVRTMSLHLGDSNQHPLGLGAIQDVVLHKLQDVL